jgi:hypothetical protein
VLFSDQKVANAINSTFEPYWESVRAVPTVNIDFGNGTVIKRTLHGNIATYVCTSDGIVVDVLPGIYEPDTYINRLSEISNAARGASIDSLQQYHMNQLAELASDRQPKQRLSTRNSSTSELANSTEWRLLVRDTKLNDVERRMVIHEKLAELKQTTPAQMKTWLYREVLHADLEDPYLGLGQTLFGTYPFAREDAIVD